MAANNITEKTLAENLSLWVFDKPHHCDSDGFTGWRVFATRKYDGKVVLGRGSSEEDAIKDCQRNIAEIYAAPTPMQEWEKKRDAVLDVLTDGHPNPEGYMEWWFSHNPPPS